MGKYFVFSHGRVALWAALKAVGVQPGDEVILTGFTCVVVANSVISLGGKCTYVDIDPRTFGTNGQLLPAVKSNKTRALIVQHSFGIPAEIDEIMAWAKKEKIAIIEDCAISVGSTYKKRELGNFGAASFWSGQLNKPISTGQGGFLKVNDYRLLDKINEIYQNISSTCFHQNLFMIFRAILREYIIHPKKRIQMLSLIKKIHQYNILKGKQINAQRYGVISKDIYLKGRKIQKWAWEKGLKKWKRSIPHRHKISYLYENNLSKLGFKIVNIMPHENIIFSRYPVRVSNKKAILQKAEQNLFEIGDWMDSPLHQACGDLGIWHYEPGMCPEGEKAAYETINLPTHERISEKEAYRIIEFLNRYALPT